MSIKDEHNTHYDPNWKKKEDEYERKRELSLWKEQCARMQTAYAKTKADLTASQRKVDDLYNLFLYAEDDPDVLEMTGGVPLLGWLEDRQEKAARRENAETNRRY